MNYDVIGDIHGHARTLHALLQQLGYRETGGAFRQAGHQVLFVGDFIDRGPEQLETLATVRAMCDAGSARAVMGNHEFNAIAWHTRDPERPDAWLRPHSAKNRAQHAAFLDAVADRPALHDEWVRWFSTLPVWLDLGPVRIVHACWHPRCMQTLLPALDADHRLTPALVARGNRRGSPEFAAFEAILKGPEAALPPPLHFDVDGVSRREARTRWWDEGATTFRASAIVDDATRRELPDTEVDAALRFGYHGAQPVFFGHYWMRGTPVLQAPRVACVDYSAGKGRPLVAYRWRGEPELDAAHFAST